MKFVLLALAAASAFAQTKSLTCDNDNQRNNQVTSCEVREQTIAYGGRLTVDGGVNGGVSIKGWDNASVLVRSKVEAYASDDSTAKMLAAQIHVNWSAGQISASGPEMSQSRNGDRNQSWAVSYEVFVPRNADLSLKTHNGGISIADVRGNIQFEAMNGGVNLKNLAGDVEGTTKNGGLNITLAGNRWDGNKLDARTTNGGVNLSMPAGYNAHFETATVNGHLNANFDMTVRGNLSEVSKKMSTDIGAGGPTIHVETVNGGVNVKRI
jgi:Putative adhesin